MSGRAVKQLSEKQANTEGMCETSMEINDRDHVIGILDSASRLNRSSGPYLSVSSCNFLQLLSRSGCCHQA